jgi:hypothetical protein
MFSSMPSCVISQERKAVALHDTVSSYRNLLPYVPCLDVAGKLLLRVVRERASSYSFAIRLCVRSRRVPIAFSHISRLFFSLSLELSRTLFSALLCSALCIIRQHQRCRRTSMCKWWKRTVLIGSSVTVCKPAAVARLRPTQNSARACTNGTS